MSNEHPESAWAGLYGGGKLIGPLRARLRRTQQWNINEDVALAERPGLSNVRRVLVVEVGFLG
jgi:hypothetical protein